MPSFAAGPSTFGAFAFALRPGDTARREHLLDFYRFHATCTIGVEISQTFRTVYHPFFSYRMCHELSLSRRPAFL